MTMASLTRVWQAHFADSLTKGLTIAADRTGAGQMKILDEPVRQKNISGGRSYVHLRVQLVGSGAEGAMTYPSSHVVFVLSTP